MGRVLGVDPRGVDDHDAVVQQRRRVHEPHTVNNIRYARISREKGDEPFPVRCRQRHAQIAGEPGA